MASGSTTAVRSRISSSGWPSSAHNPLPMRFVVVSNPAAKSRMAVETTSSSVSRSEPSDTAMSSDSRSGSGSGSALGDEPGEVLLHGHPGRLGATEVLEGRHRLEETGGGAHEILELVTVLHRHPEQLADDRHGQGEGELGHHVDAVAAGAALGHGVEEPVAQGHHMGAQRRHGVRA